MTYPGSHNGAILLEALPAMLGFEPQQAVIVVGLTSRHRTGLVMQLDRDDCLMPEVARSLGRSVAIHLSRSGYSQACIVSYGAKSLETLDPAAEAVVEALDDVVAVRDVWLVSGERFRSGWCRNFACCPRAGMPVPRTAGRVCDTTTDAPRRTLSARGRSGDPTARRRAMRARERALVAKGVRGATWDMEAFTQWRAAVEEALDGRMPSDAMCGRLLAALDVVAVRDAIVVALDGLEEAVCAEVLAGTAEALVRDSLWGLVEGRAARDAARIEASVDLCLHLASLAAGARSGANAAPLTIAAIGQWWLGDSSGAQHLADAALAAEPDYRLAQLVGATLAAGIRP